MTTMTSSSGTHYDGGTLHVPSIYAPRSSNTDAQRVVRVFEHDTTENLDLNRGDIARVHRLNVLAGSQILVPTLRNGTLEVTATQHVGVFKLASATIEVLPKLHRPSHSDDEAKFDAAKNLLSLLRFITSASSLGTLSVDLLRRSGGWLEYLTRAFAEELTHVWKIGAARRYTSTSNVLPHLKGQWRLVDQLRHPSIRHKFFCTFDEFSADTPLNQLLRYVTHELLQLTRNQMNRRLLAEVESWMLADAVTLPAEPPPFKTVVRNLTRLESHYRPALELASLFLNQSSLMLRAGGFGFSTIVIDMNRAFEGVVTKLLQRHSGEVLPPSLNGARVEVQGGLRPKFLARRNGDDAFLLKPDILLTRGGAVSLIVDTKYKLIGTTSTSFGVSAQDVYQSLAYATRFNCQHVLLVFPASDSQTQPLLETFVVTGTSARVTVATLDIRRDLSAEAEIRILRLELRTVLEGALAA